MSTFVIEGEDHNSKKAKRNGRIAAIVGGIIILILLLLPFLSFIDPMPEQEGILVALGAPDAGVGDNRPQKGEPTPVQPLPPESQPEESEKAEEEVKDIKTVDDDEAPKLPTKPKPKPKPESKPKPKPDPKPKPSENPTPAPADPEPTPEPPKKPGLTFNDDGTGPDGGDKPGKPGQENGNPLGNDPKGLGKGNIGGGLGSIGVKKTPPQPKAVTTKKGSIVLDVCINSTGKVISAAYRLKGSDIQDQALIKVAQSNALEYKFNDKPDLEPGEKICGTITYKF